MFFATSNLLVEPSTNKLSKYASLNQFCTGNALQRKYKNYKGFTLLCPSRDK